MLALGAGAALTGALPPIAFAEDQKVTLWHGWTGADNTTALNGVIDAFNEGSKG
jgi:multiple sugar transport system substrate-binding protein